MPLGVLPCSTIRRWELSMAARSPILAARGVL